MVENSMEKRVREIERDRAGDGDKSKEAEWKRRMRKELRRNDTTMQVVAVQMYTCKSIGNNPSKKSFSFELSHLAQLYLNLPY